MLKEPETMDDLVYFTRRTIGEKGKVVAWVRRQLCPVCKESLMGKPKDKKGKTQTRAKEYLCPTCGHQIERNEYEESLTAEANYTCPHCGAEGSSSAPYKRRKIDGVDTIRLQCCACKGNIDITKKLK